jgi:hypothetical protein
MPITNVYTVFRVFFPVRSVFVGKQSSFMKWGQL